jgi:hypothetical protein
MRNVKSIDDLVLLLINAFAWVILLLGYILHEYCGLRYDAISLIILVSLLDKHVVFSY